MNSLTPSAGETRKPPASRWFARPRKVLDPALRLLCFPHVGAGGAAFNAWADLLPAGVELCAVRFPGRENRLREPLLDDPGQAVDAVLTAMLPLLDRPFVLLGHCSGSVLAYECARRLQLSGHPAPALVVVSSAEGPSARHIADPLHLLSRDELLARVVDYGGTAPQVLADPDLRAMVERLLRADYRVVERLRYSPGPPLTAPIAVIGGRRDRFVSEPALRAWAAETTADFAVHMLDAPHYLLKEAGAVVGSLLAALPAAEVRT
ncbi:MULTISPECIES: thioesterase II family protein [unclassified Streptomyces]|uniref:thioesterase II family protein n=1 Tax=unclassified Streptomyces TaxID=2593676 RepID=UPI002E296B44|nr:alpha/beta fold hydrolase [Streptomyces sp. NBC_00223]